MLKTFIRRGVLIRGKLPPKNKQETKLIQVSLTATAVVQILSLKLRLSLENMTRARVQLEGCGTTGGSDSVDTLSSEKHLPENSRTLRWNRMKNLCRFLSAVNAVETR